ncbi:hypothetical protein [Cyanobacterium stanieri]|uniref:hypothetical protein n=1 Tax=Cyanobacterium stanieri TaxID=102235 RepID=UPI001F50D8C6|nr:hypothetical protein [Cyanobacterium stanieri]
MSFGLSFVLLSSSVLVTKNTFAHTNKDNNHHNSPSSSHSHSHKSIDISNHDLIPNIEIEVMEDTMTGWNVKIITDNFTFAPETVNQESNINQGHAHLYINGEKITRIYDNWYYISDLPKGENEIKINLNTNLHEELIYQGTIIGDRTVIINN